ncbi:PREDICTED: transcription factor bHLH93-like [Tarenaya hassleriana]|uniref:transcription factor bHLH93-like n=1 Tax=Tarenaya hassleriana TaxID=28532 RepID=UPI00053C2B52|nr:PREDICTED: transcription factor bHLH93-like [Tarenaya hassleriana]
MEQKEDGFMEDAMEARTETWANNLCNNEVYDLRFPNEWSFGCFNEIPVLPTSTPSFMELISNPTLAECPFSMISEDHLQFFGGGSFAHEEYNYAPSLFDQEQCNISCCKVETNRDNIINVSHDSKGKGKVKNLQGQPSKNLLAERRRRKRLNERLSMLRSIVPKITKMDRTSILADAIDYMKELLDKINRLEEKEPDNSRNPTNLVRGLRQLKNTKAGATNSLKFEVERRECDTRIDFCCEAKPGLLLSTVCTLEALGLEIQQCVISSFGDFSFQASCSENAEQRELRGCEDLKEALLRNVGYGRIFS